jgi:hypothetical protein
MSVVIAPCREPSLNEALTDFCFDKVSPDREQALALHLLDCDTCWQQLTELLPAVRALKVSPELKPMQVSREALSAVGISGRLDRQFGGHARYAIGISVLFGLEWLVGLWSELGYSYDRFGSLAWRLSLPTGVAAAGVLIAVLRTDVLATRAGSRNGLPRAGGLLLVGLGLLTAALVFILPAERTIDASFQTRTAAGGYFKDVFFIFVPLLVFVVSPFDVVVRLQRELVVGRSESVLKVLTKTTDRLAPRGMVYIPPQLLGAILLVLGVIKLVGTNNMLDALTPGPYANLFTEASYVSTAIWFAIDIWSLVWYTNSLNELKREALALSQLASRSAGEMASS